MKKTRGMAEAEFTTAMIKFEKEYLGRGPLEARTVFIDDMVLVRLQGILTHAEKTLAQTEEGRNLVKEMRRQLFETSVPLLEEIIQQVTGCQLVSMHTDMSTATGERIAVFVLSENVAEKFPATRK